MLEASVPPVPDGNCDPSSADYSNQDILHACIARQLIPVWGLNHFVSSPVVRRVKSNGTAFPYRNAFAAICFETVGADRLEAVHVLRGLWMEVGEGGRAGATERGSPTATPVLHLLGNSDGSVSGGGGGAVGRVFAVEYVGVCVSWGGRGGRGG